MNRAQRRWHRRLWIVLAPVLAGVIAFAIRPVASTDAPGSSVTHASGR